ncbi:MAG: hypothetical protein ABIP89_19595 [Polyangiaceae bacterium]
MLAVLAAASIVGACANNDDNQTTSPSDVGMTDKIAPIYTDGQTTIYQVETAVKLPFRKPTDDERQALGDAPGLPRAPFLKASDARIEIRFTISNLDDQQHAVELLLDPWNEFVRYKPGIQIVSDEQTTPDFSGFDKPFLVPAKSRVQGTITSDDVNEMAIDLATVEGINKSPPMGPNVNLNGLFNHVFNLQNRSNQPDPLVAPFLPKVVPGLTGFDLGLRITQAEGAMGAGNVAVEVIVDITDLHGDRINAPGVTDNMMGVPGTVLQPPKAIAQ